MTERARAGQVNRDGYRALEVMLKALVFKLLETVDHSRVLSKGTTQSDISFAKTGYCVGNSRSR